MSKNMHVHNEPRDLELNQCHVRTGLNIVILIWYGLWLPFQPVAAQRGLVMCVGFLILAIIHWQFVRRYPGNYPVRRTLALIGDQGISPVAMLTTGELGTIMLFIMTWTSVGYGMRFGVRWLIASVLLADLGLIVVGGFSDYWHQHLILIFTLVLLNTGIPALAGYLVGGLEAARAKLANFASEMESMALKDSLTGLANRAALIDELERVCNSTQSESTSRALLYFDLDGFKRVNDTYGHALGDKLLKEVTSRVKGIIRTDDVFARLGGDEFVVLLKTHAYESYTGKVADRIREVVALISVLDDKPLSVSASIGGVMLSGTGTVRLDADKLIQEADRNMYQAKRNGKNQVVLSYSKGPCSTDVQAN
jgi:diguanylate cyclase (GGDEF)-like protein